MKRTIFIGTYTTGGSEGIHSCRFDSATGDLDERRLAARTPNPSFLALHPNKKFLYAVNETEKYQGARSGSVTAYLITDVEAGALQKLNTVSARGASPCHLAVSPKGNSVITANYHGGTVCVLGIQEDGSLGNPLNTFTHEGSSENKSRQEAPHPHAIAIDPGGRFVHVADLGTDRIVKYKLEDNGSLTPQKEFTRVAPGSGPRHFAFHPSGKFGYVINEMARTITGFTYDADSGTLAEIETVSTVAEGWETGSTAEIFAHPNGKFLYGSNRGHDSIVAYRIKAESGTLIAVDREKSGGRTPRSFAIDPEGRFLVVANRNSGDLHVFSIDPRTGALEPEMGRLEIPSPVCVLFHP